MFVLEVAAELVGQFAGGGDHQVQGLLGVAWAGQAHEEADGAHASTVHLVQVEHTGLEGVGHGEQHISIAAHALVAMEDVHVAVAQSAFQNALVQGRAGETFLVAGHHVDNQHFLHRCRLFGRGGGFVLSAGGFLVRTGRGLALGLFRGARFGEGVEQYRYWLFQVQADLFGLATGWRLTYFVGLGQDRQVIGQRWLFPLMAPNHTRRPQQFVAALLFRQILQVALQLEADTRAAAHAPPAIKQNTCDHQKANNDKPLTQTEIHEYPDPVY